MDKEKNFHLKMPNTLVLIFLTLVLTGFCTYFIPGGSYQREKKQTTIGEQEVPVPGSFRYESNNPQLWGILTSPVKGFCDAAKIIVFLLIIGGTFKIIEETGAITAVIQKMTRTLGERHNLQILFIPIMMIIFSLGGAVFGMCEETMPFILIFVPLALSLRYDSIVGVAIPFLGAAAGFAGAFFNPFTVGIAQELAGIPMYSGMSYRMLVWGIVTLITIVYVMQYAYRVQKNPEISHVLDLDNAKREQLKVSNATDTSVTVRHILILTVFVLSIALLVFGILKWEWYIKEIAGLFLALGIVSGLLGGLDSDKIAKACASGAKDMINPVLIIACARAILVIATDGKILDTILYAMASFLSHFPTIITAWLMFYVQCVINFFVHSGSSQASLTIPIMSPLSDLVGISRQTAVLAFQLCELVNPVLPTSGVTMGVLGLAGIPWGRWIKWMLPLLFMYFVLTMLLLIWPIMVHWM